MPLKPTWFKALIFLFFGVIHIAAHPPQGRLGIARRLLSQEDALVNRAIIMRGACDPEKKQKQNEEAPADD